MARTVQQALDRIREILQDEEGTRYTTPQLTAHIVDGIVAARAIRPDLFVANYHTPLPDELEPEGTIPLPDQFYAALCHYVAGNAELRDDEFAVDGRAMTLRAMLEKKLVTGM